MYFQLQGEILKYKHVPHFNVTLKYVFFTNTGSFAITRYIPVTAKFSLKLFFVHILRSAEVNFHRFVSADYVHFLKPFRIIVLLKC